MCIRDSLRVVGCAFFDNEMGILTGNDVDAVLEVEDSEFGAAPKHAGSLHHLLYAGTIARLSVRAVSYTHLLYHNKVLHERVVLLLSLIHI